MIKSRSDWIGLRLIEGPGGDADEAVSDPPASVMTASDTGGFGGRGHRGKDAAGEAEREFAREGGSVPVPGNLNWNMHVGRIAGSHVSSWEEGRQLDRRWTWMETPYPVIDLLREQKEVADLGGKDEPGRPTRSDPTTVCKG